MDISLDGFAMDTREAAHDHLQAQFGFPAYYGRNLDALYDLLSAICTPTRILLWNKNAMIQALDAYGDEMLECFEQAAEENPYIELYLL